LKKQQKLDEGGEDGEILEYTKSMYAVRLPESKVVLPRQQPPPKPKPLTKWEKFRQEKGLLQKQKRSRMVFDPISQDWVPRFGYGSIKKIEDETNWAMEEKPKHVEAGLDPFTYKKMEKKLEKEKQDLRELKNKMLAAQTMTGSKRTND
jgi:regulator of ribosome biosynthesis